MTIEETLSLLTDEQLKEVEQKIDAIGLESQESQCPTQSYPGTEQAKPPVS